MHSAHRDQKIHENKDVSSTDENRNGSGDVEYHDDHGSNNNIESDVEREMNEFVALSASEFERDLEFYRAVDRIESEYEREIEETEEQMTHVEEYLEEEQRRLNGQVKAGTTFTLWVPGHGYVNDEEYVRITGDTQYVDNPLPTFVPSPEEKNRCGKNIIDPSYLTNIGTHKDVAVDDINNNAGGAFVKQKVTTSSNDNDNQELMNDDEQSSTNNTTSQSPTHRPL